MFAPKLVLRLTVLVGLLLAPVVACRATGSADATPTEGPLRPTVVPGISNYAVIADGLARGGQPDQAGLEYLKAQGFRTIINLREHHSERRVAEALGLKVVELPIRANIVDSAPPTDEQVRTFFEVICDPSRRPVFFHCAHGKDRTGTMAALYRIEIDGWTKEQAIEEMQVFGYHDVYHDLIDYVRRYEPRGFKPAR